MGHYALGSGMDDTPLPPLAPYSHLDEQTFDDTQNQIEIPPHQLGAGTDDGPPPTDDVPLGSPPPYSSIAGFHPVTIDMALDPAASPTAGSQSPTAATGSQSHTDDGTPACALCAERFPGQQDTIWFDRQCCTQSGAMIC